MSDLFTPNYAIKRERRTHCSNILLTTHICTIQVSITFKIFLKTFWVIWTATRSSAHLVRSRDPHINMDSSINATTTPEIWRSHEIKLMDVS